MVVLRGQAVFSERGAPVSVSDPETDHTRSTQPPRAQKRSVTDDRPIQNPVPRQDLLGKKVLRRARPGMTIPRRAPPGISVPRRVRPGIGPHSKGGTPLLRNVSLVFQSPCFEGPQGVLAIRVSVIRSSGRIVHVDKVHGPMISVSGKNQC